ATRPARAALVARSVALSSAARALGAGDGPVFGRDGQSAAAPLPAPDVLPVQEERAVRAEDEHAVAGLNGAETVQRDERHLVLVVVAALDAGVRAGAVEASGAGAAALSARPRLGRGPDRLA